MFVGGKKREKLTVGFVVVIAIRSLYEDTESPI